MADFEVILTDSLEKVLPNARPRPMADTRLTVFGGETVSFQLAARAMHDTVGSGEALTLRFLGPLADRVRVRRVELEPVLLAAYDGVDGNYLTHTAAMLPDPLTPFAPGEPAVLRCVGSQWGSVWCDLVLSADVPAGEQPLTVELTDGLQRTAARFVLTLCVQPDALPAQTLYHTEWFHADCLADYYHVPVWSRKHWEIVENFMAAAADVGINMLLTPLFTPALDTWVGGERTTTQLVDVTRENDVYRFGFERLDHWIRLCRKHGITELELCHLFTQWGAAAAPKVIATVDGVEKRLFGWDTPAVGGEYTVFLQAFLPQLKEHLAGCGMLEHSWFHISDEPSEENMEQWNAARCTVAPLLEGCHVIDALSSFRLYEKGYIRTPIVSEEHLEPFIEAEVPGLWTYYCCGQHTDVPNRFLAMPSARNRILGVLLYRYRLAGFLQWGFNFYNGVHSTCRVDPWRNADGLGTWPAGDPFLVYPAPDGTAWESLRAAVLREAMQDLRLLQLAEQHLGRPAVLALLQGCWEGGELTMKHYPTDPAYFTRLRRAVAAALAGK